MTTATLRPYNLELSPVPDGLQHKACRDGLEIIYRAQNLRQSGGHINATCTIGRDGMILQWGTIKIDKAEERLRLHNAAMHTLLQKPPPPTEEAFRHIFDLFCNRVWPAWCSRFDVEDMVAEEAPGPLPMIIPGQIIEGGGTILAAPPGGAKSWMLMLMAQSIQHGSRVLWNIPYRRNVLLINLERSAQSVRRRLSMVNRVLGLAYNEPMSIMNARGRSLADVITSATRIKRERKIDVVLLDSISRAGVGKLVEESTANQITDQLNGLCETWCAIGHTSRADANHVFGSIHFDAGADIVTIVRSVDRENGMVKAVGLKVTKSNDIVKTGAMQVFKFSFEENAGLVKVERSTEQAFPDLKEGTVLSNLDKIKAYLEEHSKGSATAIHEITKVPRTTVVSILDDEAIFVKLEKLGREQLYGLRIRGE